jgi:hypothetical protein
MMMKRRATLEEHLVLAKKVRQVNDLMTEISVIVGETFTKKHSAQAWRACNAISMLKSKLDSEYHAVITDDQFRRLGHIYYGAPDENA